MLTLPLAMTACGSCYLPGADAKESCNKQLQAEVANREKKAQQDLPALRKRADAGDVNAQASLGNFHVLGQHANSQRAVGIAYFEKAGKQGDLRSLRHFVYETYIDCQRSAREIGRNQRLTTEQINATGPPLSPHCDAQWAAVEVLAAKTCVTRFPSESSAMYSLAYLVAQTYDDVDRADEADFWFLVARNSCTTVGRGTANDISYFGANPRSQRGSHELRGAMWFEMRGWRNSQNLPQPSPEVSEQAKQRMAMLQEKVARSGIRPAP